MLRRFACQAACTLLCFAAFCLHGQSAHAADFVYVATQNGTIRQFATRSDGTLAPLSVPVVRVAPPKFPVTLVLHPTRPLAYAATVDDKSHKATIYPYRIQENGGLAPIKKGSVAVKSAVRNLLADPQGRFLWAVGEEGKVFAFLCLRDGTLKTLPTNTVYGTFGIAEMVGNIDVGELDIDPSGRFAYLHYLSGFVDHSERHQIVYRISPSGVFRTFGGEISDTNGDAAHPNDFLIGKIGFDRAGKWVFLNAYYSHAVVLLRRQRSGLAVVRKQVLPDEAAKPPIFDTLSLLDSKHSAAVLVNRKNELIFARVASGGTLTPYGRVFVPEIRNDSPMVWSRDTRFLTTVSLLVHDDARGRKVTPPFLVVIHTSDPSRPPKVIQTVQLSGDFVQTIVSRAN